MVCSLLITLTSISCLGSILLPKARGAQRGHTCQDLRHDAVSWAVEEIIRTDNHCTTVQTDTRQFLQLGEQSGAHVLGDEDTMETLDRQKFQGNSAATELVATPAGNSSFVEFVKARFISAIGLESAGHLMMPSAMAPVFVPSGNWNSSQTRNNDPPQMKKALHASYLSVRAALVKKVQENTEACVVMIIVVVALFIMRLVDFVAAFSGSLRHQQLERHSMGSEIERDSPQSPSSLNLRPTVLFDPAPPAEKLFTPEALVKHASVPATSQSVTATGTRSSEPTRQDSSDKLCPALLVPDGHNCVLTFPMLHTLNMPPRTSAAFFVRDLQGNPTVQGEIAAVPWSSIRDGGEAQRPIVLLRTTLPKDNPVISIQTPLLAYAKASISPSGARSASIYTSKDDVFAHLAKRTSCSNYSLTSSRISTVINFAGNYAAGCMQVTSGFGEPVAEVRSHVTSFDPAGDCFKVRIFSHVDVGLILCCMLAIQHMEE